MVETDPEKRITQYDYCSCGAINRLIDPNGSVTRWKYDIQGRITEKIHADGTTASYDYDPYNGRLLSSTDALEQITEYTYHLDNNLHEIIFPNAIHPTHKHTWIWDPNYKRPHTLTDGTGTTEWTYHPNGGSTLGAGQIATIDGPLSNDTITRLYDSLGRIETRQIHGSANSLARQFDSLGRLEDEINRLGTFGYQYLNQTSQLVVLTYPGDQSTHLSYKPNIEDRRLRRIEHRLANSSILAAHEYGHDDEGSITSWKQERSGLDTRTWHYGYDAATRLTSAVLKNPLDVVTKTHGWQYDPGNNRIASETDASGIVPTRHNKLNQLLAHGSGPVRFAGTLDEPGTVTVNGLDAKMRNQTLFEAYLDLHPGTHEIEIEATDFSENTTAQSYEVEIADEPETEFLYDLNGNLNTKTTATGTTTYEWDALDRLITIIHEDATSSHFAYDGLSRRVRITEKDAIETITSDKRFVWDDLTIAEERATNGTAVNKRFYPQGVELVTGPDAGTYTYRTDHLGSIREVVDSIGSLAGRYDYAAWGEPDIVSGAFDLDFRYTGHYYHQPSDLYLAPFRAYDARLGRWLSADPIGEAGGMNLYAYVGGNPINEWDPTGLASWRDHWDALGSWTGDELGESLGLGAMATADGFIPFSDPFKESGGYSGCEDGASFSNGAGQVAFGAAASGAAIGGAQALSKAAGGLKQWVRIGSSYSHNLGQKVPLSIRWGASPKYAKKIPNQLLRNLNQWLCGKRLPPGMSNPRTADPGHCHIKF